MCFVVSFEGILAGLFSHTVFRFPRDGWSGPVVRGGIGTRPTWVCLTLSEQLTVTQHHRLLQGCSKGSRKESHRVVSTDFDTQTEYVATDKTLNGCGSKIGTQNGTLVHENADQNPCILVVTHFDPKPEAPRLGLETRGTCNGPMDCRPNGAIRIQRQSEDVYQWYGLNR